MAKSMNTRALNLLEELKGLFGGATAAKKTTAKSKRAKTSKGAKTKTAKRKAKKKSKS